MPVSESPGGAGEVSSVRGGVVIDAGMRHWYQSCPCCLSTAYPEVKRTLDAEGRVEPGSSGDGPAE